MSSSWIARAYGLWIERLHSIPLLHKGLLAGVIVVAFASAAPSLFRPFYAGKSFDRSKDCASIEDAQIREYINLNGLVNPSVSINLTSEKTGRVSQLFVKEGFSVKKGQVVAILDTRDIDMQIRNKQKELSALRQKSIRLERRADRIVSLSRQGMMPMTDKEETEAQVFDNRASLARAESELVTLERERSNNVIVSPFDGTVAQIFAFPGTFVSPMTSASDSDQSTKSTIMQIYSHLQVVINSPEALIFDILNSSGVTVSPTTDPEIRVPARIERVMPYVVMTREKVSAIPVRLDLADARPFLPGMNVDIAIAKNPISGLGVKTHSIVRKNGQNGLLACDSRLTFRQIDVLGESDGTSVVAPSKYVKRGFRYSMVGLPPSKPPGILDYFKKDGVEKLKKGMDVNPFR